MTQPSNRRRARRCPNDQYGPCMEFVYAGPLHRLVDSRVGRSFVKASRNLAGHIIEPSPRYSATAENYTIGAAVGRDVALALEARFGRERASAPGRSGRSRPRRKATT